MVSRVYISNVTLLLRLGLAMYCCRVKQSSPMDLPGQGLSGVGIKLVAVDILDGVVQDEQDCQFHE